MTLDREEEEDRIHSLGLAMKEVSSSQSGKIQMTGGIAGMSQDGLSEAAAAKKDDWDNDWEDDAWESLSKDD